MYEKVGADMLRYMEGNTLEAQSQGFQGDPPGSKTVACQQGKAGNSGDPIDSSDTGVGQHNRKPGGSLMIHGKSDVLIVVTKK